MKNHKIMKVLWNIFLLLLCFASILFVEISCFTKYLAFKFDGYSMQLSIIWDCIIVCAAVISVILHYFAFDRRKNVGVYHWITFCFGSLMALFVLSNLFFHDLLLNVEIYDAIGLIVVQIMIFVSRATAIIKQRKNRL